ncbi:MAG: isomerizing glutamine--fructose-6-phosphate transaminase, partial [Streptococcus lutetiensis]|nr:isomerizing glutamine--fructose-6-phosphate transaminase [Streptococcus lutetiensis]
EDFMLKEIHEQPKAVKDTLAGKIALGKEITLDNITFTKEQLENFDKIYVVACGTAYHAGVVGKTVIEKFAKIPVEIDIASEFRYRDPMIANKTLLIVVSQSGETADTLAVLRDAKKQGARVLAITNVVGSSVSREADDVFYTLAGPEIAVASTKAYTAQVATLAILAKAVGDANGNKVAADFDVVHELAIVAQSIEATLSEKDTIAEKAEVLLKETRNAFYIGRGSDYYVAMEASLKLKEISYIQCEGFAAGELKHGTISLIEEGVPVIALISSNPVLASHTRGNIQEVEARGASVLTIVDESQAREGDDIIVTTVHPFLSAIAMVVPAQLIAYYATLQRGLDVDKPRNLAKSVTVE